MPPPRSVRLALALGLLVPTLTACFEEPSPHEAIRDFLVGWESGDYAMAARRADANEASVRKALGDVALHLDAASLRFKLGPISRDGDTAKASFQAEVDLGENNPLWTYESMLPLHLVDGRWKVRWSPSVIHPDLHEGERLAVKVDPEGRQPIMDRYDDALQDRDTQYVAQVIPVEVSDPARLCQELAKVTGFAQDRLLSRILSAPPTDAVPLATFGRAKYQQIRAQLARIDGLKIAEVYPPVAPKSPVHIVGRVSAVTAESEQQLGGPQRAGDTVGRDGLQRAYQDQLTGSTETRVIVLDTKTWKTVKELKSWPGRKNTPVRTTIDSRLQHAADLAVARTQPVALVAVDAPTGQVLAVATKDLHQEKDALAGKYPVGTAFSIVATDALLRGGLDVRQKVPCTADRTVGGARFQQTGVTSSAPSFEADFAHGCVTALASLARRLDERSLTESAANFGIGAPWGLPLNSFSGTVPAGTTDAARAKIIAGSAVRVSPLAMALVAGAVRSGTWHPPTLVTAPASPDPTSDITPPQVPAARPLNVDAAAKLRALMRAGVATGSARAAAAPGDPVHGVASTVTFVEKKERRELSWFVGWQGDVAVAVMMEGPDPAGAASVAGAFFSGTRKDF
ncbi:penicillin-binding protein [Acrocarpospora phusangensis]|uniref:Penicillin-binding protein n=1 Tax=Acrocarpospora phusangensis TaxID=1070424 RepID=A0A919Q8G3_9ACTN|nr:penicillin-binding transpeptidase domain-containing protein [Acrocarpospora phusangensis]GIH22135.1 penicillin-binding protein [Acrocarpospora phusangensis]